MRPVFLRTVVATAAGALAATFVGCSGKQEPAKGQIMLAVQTDMSIPNDIDQVTLQVSIFGRTQFQADYDVGPEGVKIPATLGIVAGENPADPVTIKVIARQKGKLRMLREAITTVPPDRIALLRMPIHWLCCDDFAMEQGIDDAVSTCADGQTCVAGACQDKNVDSQVLSLYTPADVFGGGSGQGDAGGGACFDTVACFAEGYDTPVNLSDCTIAAPVNAGQGTNVAVVNALGKDGICGQGACLIPLDAEHAEGWQTKGDRIQLPQGVCDRLGHMRSLAVAVTTACAPKTETMPTCGPWSSVSTNPGTFDAGAPDAAGLNAADGDVVDSGFSDGSAGGPIADSGVNDAPTLDGGGRDASACTSTTVNAVPVDANLYFVLDTAGLIGDAGVSATFWTVTQSALQNLINDSASAGVGMGLGFFGTNQSCLPADYAAPAVPISLLPGGANALTAALSGQTPGGASATTSAALEGSITQATTYATAHPGSRTAVVLVTGGLPNACVTDMPSIAAIAQTGFNAGVPTYVVGFGASLAPYDAVASSGGTGIARLVDLASGTLPQDMTGLLDGVRDEMHPACTYALPGGVPASTVGVQIQATAKDPAVTLPFRSNVGACGDFTGYYIDLPTQSVRLCPTSCSTVGSSLVELVLSCSTGTCAPPVDAGACGACTVGACCAELGACEADPNCSVALAEYWSCIELGGGLSCVDTFTQSAGDASVTGGNLAGQLGNCQAPTEKCGSACGLIIPS